MTHIPKLVELNIEVRPDGSVHITPSGTEGAECLDILKFLKEMQGARLVSLETNDDYHKGDNVHLTPILTIQEETS